MNLKNEDGHLYGSYYFRHCCGKPYERTPEWLHFFANIAEEIIRRINPETVLDVGCAMGFLVEAFRDRGRQAFGLDISDFALQKVRQDLAPFFRKASLLDPIPDRYDLVVSIEILEHLSPQDSGRAIENMCRASDDIVFSSTPEDYGEATHKNVQPPEYWAEWFALYGFVRDVDFDASFITPWAVRFRRNHELLHRTIRNYERKFWSLWKENTDLRTVNLRMQNQLASLEERLEAKEIDLQNLSGALEREIDQREAAEERVRESQERIESLQRQLERWGAFSRSKRFRLINALGRLTPPAG